MKNQKILSAVLGGLLGATMMTVVIGLLNFGAIASVSLSRSIFLPHLLMSSAIRDPAMGDTRFALAPAVLLAAHAAVVLLAILVAGLAQARARRAEWSLWLGYGLGGLAFYVAHFCFLHPGNPGLPASLGVRLLDYLAIAAAATGVWSLLKFALSFPKKHDAAGFDAFVTRRMQKIQEKAAASKFPLRRWLARQSSLHSLDQAARFRRRELWFCQSPWLPVALTVIGLAVLWQSQFLSSRGEIRFLVRLVTVYLGFLVMIVPLGLVSGVIDWQRHEAQPIARRVAATIWWSVTTAFWASLALGLVAMLGVFITQEGSSIGLFMLTVPVGVLLVSFAFIVAVAIATWSAPLDSAAVST